MKEKANLLEDFVFQFEAVDACPLCGSPDSNPGEIFPGIITMDQEYKIYYKVCKVCGHMYMDPRPDDATVDALYTTGSYRGLLGHMRPDLGDFTSETWRGLRVVSLISTMVYEGIIKIGSAIDIGGSTGALLYILASELRHQKLSKVLNVELNSRFAIWGREKGILDVRTMKQALAYAPFDFVACVHVLEHTNHPREFLEEVISMGKTGSTYYIEVPTVRTNACGIFHPQVFNPENLEALCKELGLEIIRRGNIKIENNQEAKEHMVVARRV